MAQKFKLLKQRCSRAGVQESTPAGVIVFQQEPEQDQEWIFLIGRGRRAGAGVIFKPSSFNILMVTYIIRKLKQESDKIRSRYILCIQESYQEQESTVKTQKRSRSGKNQTPHTSILKKFC